jgi:RAB protein geranylgeranyltransferase component A
MRIADILRTLANNLEHAEGGAPDPRIQNPAELIDVVVVGDEEQTSPNGTTDAGNDREPEDLFLPPLQQKQELLKKAVGVENVYDDGTPAEQHEQEQEDDMSAERQDIVDRIKQLSGVPVAAIQELSNDEVFDD